jgi:prepilin-type N-terminal cleavage/methylation domain-containing protein
MEYKIKYKCSEYLQKYLIKGFTLAEVLITLLIIGIISSIVIPGLVSDIQDQQYKVAWKKSYASLNQVINLLISDNAGTLVNMCGSFDNDCLFNKFSQYLNDIKVCISSTNNNCIKTPKYLSGAPYASIDSFIKDARSSIFMLANGSVFLIRWHDGSCTFPTNNNKCGWMLVDVNGDKGPNTIGKDVYFICIKSNKILPFGANGTDYVGVNDCNSQGQGMSCASLYLTQ